MPSLNKVTLIGHLGRDPEIRSTNYGDRIGNLSVATEERWKDKNSGEWRGKTEWHRVVVFDERAVNFADAYLRKGSMVYVEGQLQTRKWTDQSGAEKYTTEVVIQKFGGQLIGLDKMERNDAAPTTGGGRPGSGGGKPTDLDDEIPFAPCK